MKSMRQSFITVLSESEQRLSLGRTENAVLNNCKNFQIYGLVKQKKMMFKLQGIISPHNTITYQKIKYSHKQAHSHTFFLCFYLTAK